jgi:hypothetical protein
MFNYAKQPLKLHEWITHSFRLCKSSYKNVLAYAFLVTLAGVAGNFATHLRVTSANAIMISIVAIVVIVLAFIVGISAYVALVKKMYALSHHHKMAGWWSELFHGVKSFWWMLGGVLLVTIFVVLGYCLFLLPGIFLTVAWFIYLPLLALREVTPWKGLSDSISMTWGHWWKTLLLLAFTMIIYFIAYGVIWLIIDLIGIHHHYSIINGLVHLVVGTFFYPWFVAISLILIHQFKITRS